MRLLPFALLLAACPSPHNEEIPVDTHDGSPTDDTGASPVDCGLLGSFTVDGLDADGRATPGATLDLLTSGVATEAEHAWETDLGTIEGDSWTLPDDEGIHVDTAATLTLSASAPGCLPESTSATVPVGFTEESRVVVIYNPDAEGSEEVARAYADLHGLEELQLCGIPATTDSTLAYADYSAYISSVHDCIGTVGPQVHTLVPVYGTPYKTADRIEDIGTGTAVTVSLDALLVFGTDARLMKAAVYNPAWQESDSMAGTYDPWIPWGELREAYGDELYMVVRVDGADADAALALVDRFAESIDAAAAGELDGIVYVDGRYGDTEPLTDAFGSYESGEWNMWGTRNLFEELGWYEVIWDGNDAEFGTEPAPTECTDALYYAGWYSYYNYNDCFTWNVGAVGGHLDSCSACDIRNPGTWVGSALIDGITFTFGAVNEPYVAGMPEYDQLFRYLAEGASYGEAAYESTVVGGWMMTFVGDPLYRPYAAP